MNKKGIAEIPNAVISIVACLIAVGIGIGGFILLKGKGSKIDSLTFNDDTYEVSVGGTLQLDVKISPEGAEKEKLTWTSNSASASVDNNGLVTGNSVGNATIIVSTDNGKTARCVVKVTGSGSITPTPTSTPTSVPTPTPTPTQTPTQSGGKVDSKYVKVSTTSLSVKKGSTAKFDIIMSNAAGAITIKSSNPSVADVNMSQEFMDSTSESSKDTKTVTVTGKEVGTATITVTLSDVATYDTVKSLSGSYTITVNVK